MVQAAELLLQERTPRAVAITRPRAEEVQVAAHVRDLLPPTLRRFDSPHDIPPAPIFSPTDATRSWSRQLAPGSADGAKLAVTRWREDTTRDGWGRSSFCGTWGPVACGPLVSAERNPADHYDVVYSEDRAKIMQSDRSLFDHPRDVVSPDDDADSAG